MFQNYIRACLVCAAFLGQIAGAMGRNVGPQLPSDLDSDTAAKAPSTFVIFKGIPEGIVLSSGFHRPNLWIVAINNIKNLSMTFPPTYQGDFTIDVFLYRGETVAPEKRTIAVHVSLPQASPPMSADSAATSQSASEKPARTQAHRALSLSKEEERELLSQGLAQLKNGNIVFARLLFEQLATAGSALGLFELARTYDPTALEQLGAVGVQGDPEKAKELYRKAAELGSAAAPKMLGALGNKEGR
ncbi:MAG: sel1 repeat family protein [Rhodomicrobium sp.]|nr:sel1 repeat family protein [Rhodomicrobium sp.]